MIATFNSGLRSYYFFWPTLFLFSIVLAKPVPFLSPSLSPYISSSIACSFFEISLVCATCHTFSFHILLSVYPFNVLSRTGPSRDHLPTTLLSEHFHYSSFFPQPVPFFNCSSIACSFFELLYLSLFLSHYV